MATMKYIYLLLYCFFSVQCAHSGSQFSTALCNLSAILVIYMFGFNHFETEVCVNNLGMSRTIKTVFSLIMWSEICIFIITHNGHFGHCELYADHSTLASNESVYLHTDNHDWRSAMSTA